MISIIAQIWLLKLLVSIDHIGFLAFLNAKWFNHMCFATEMRRLILFILRGMSVALPLIEGLFLRRVFNKWNPLRFKVAAFLDYLLLEKWKISLFIWMSLEGQVVQVLTAVALVRCPGRLINLVWVLAQPTKCWNACLGSRSSNQRIEGALWRVYYLSLKLCFSILLARFLVWIKDPTLLV